MDKQAYLGAGRSLHRNALDIHIPHCYKHHYADMDTYILVLKIKICSKYKLPLKFMGINTRQLLLYFLNAYNVVCVITHMHLNTTKKYFVCL